MLVLIALGHVHSKTRFLNFRTHFFGAIAEYPAQLVVFDSTATVVRGTQSVSKVYVTMCCSR